MSISQLEPSPTPSMPEVVREVPQGEVDDIFWNDWESYGEAVYKQFHVERTCSESTTLPMQEESSTKKKSDKSSTKKKRKCMKPDIVLDDEDDDVADVTIIPEEELDDLPDNGPKEPTIDELPVDDEYHNGFSESDDPNFEAGTDIDDESDEDYLGLVEVSDVKEHEEFQNNAAEEEPPRYAKNKGCSKSMDDLYSDKDCGVQEDEPLEIQKLEKGLEWPSLDDFIRFLSTYCIFKKFEVHGEKNESYRYRGKCKGKDSEGGDCKWMIYVKKAKYATNCSLVTLNDVHTCHSNIQGKNTMANSTWVSYEIERDITENEMSFTPRNVVAKIRNAHGIPITYWVAWKARAKALTRIYGSYEDGYIKAPEYCRQILIANPDSVATCSRDNREGHFTSMCIAFKPMLQGFVEGCRPLVGLDGCHLKGKYGGVCLSAIALDGNNGLFPLAIFICSIEDTQNWLKFLQIISPDLTLHNDPLTFISDRQKGLIEAVKTVFGGCRHRFYFRHLYKNFKRAHKGEQLEILAWGAAKAFRDADHQKWMEMMNVASPTAHAWFLANEPVSWTRSKFDTTSKCEHITNNFSESFNNWILDLRDKPLQRFVDEYHLRIMTLMFERKQIAKTWDVNGLVPRAVRIIANLSMKTRKYSVKGAADFLWCATNKKTGERWLVDMDRKTCTCQVWDLTGLPCVHAVAVIDQLRLPFSDFCHDYHKVSAYLKSYSGHITPMANSSEWGEPSYVVQPPPEPKKVGRPKTQRRRDPDEGPRPTKISRKCTRCGVQGHNKRSCKGPRTNAPRVIRPRVVGAQRATPSSSRATPKAPIPATRTPSQPTQQQVTNEASSSRATAAHVANQQYVREATTVASATATAASVNNFYQIYGFRPDGMRPPNRPPSQIFVPPVRLFGNKYQPYRPVGPRGG